MQQEERKMFKFKLAFVSALLLSTGVALAEYPEKPITILVGYKAGGGTDVMARNVAPFIEKHLGNGASVVVKNKPGASGMIAVTEVAQSEPDGYTLGTYNLPGMMARTLDRPSKISADSFTYLANFVNDPNVIVTSKSSGITTLKGFVEAAKKTPRAITVGMSSLGGDDHIALTKFQAQAGAEFTIVPFKGSAPTRTAIMGGHVAAGVLNISEVAKFRSELNVLGVATLTRSEFGPDLPTLKEQGYNITNGSMRGIIAPKGLPKDVESKLLAAMEKVGKDPEFLKKMKETANPTDVSVGDAFKTVNAEQLEVAKKIWETTPWK
jgi:tripartite-type tricarboxylate transporter receptor subunit TctC